MASPHPYTMNPAALDGAPRRRVQPDGWGFTGNISGPALSQTGVVQGGVSTLEIIACPDLEVRPPQVAPGCEGRSPSRE